MFFTENKSNKQKKRQFYVSSLIFFRNMMNLHLFYLNLHPNMSIVFKPMDVFFFVKDGEWFNCFLYHFSWLFMLGLEICWKKSIIK